MARSRASLHILLLLAAGAALSNGVDVAINPQQVPVLEKWAKRFSDVLTPELGWAKPWNCGSVSNIKCDGTGNVVALILSGQFGGPCTEQLLSSTNCPTNIKLAGPIPAFVGELATLTAFAIDAQLLNSTLPPELYNLTNLAYLSFGGNMFTGEISDDISKLQKLAFLSAASSLYITGPFPAAVGSLSELTFLSLGGTNMDGPIPPSYGNLVKMRDMYMTGTTLRGQIPQSFSALTNLSSLVLAQSKLTGPVPPYLGDFTNLKQLKLTKSNFIGDIPDTLTKLALLSILDLGDNPQLGGVLSPGFSQLANIYPPQGQGQTLKSIYFGGTNATCPLNSKSNCIGPPPVNVTSQFCLWMCPAFCNNCSKGIYNNSQGLGEPVKDIKPNTDYFLPPPAESPPPSPPTANPPPTVTSVYDNPPPAPDANSAPPPTDAGSAPPPTGAGTSLPPPETGMIAAATNRPSPPSNSSPPLSRPLLTLTLLALAAGMSSLV